MPTMPMDDPYDWFRLWFDEALASDEIEPTAMGLATVSPDGAPTTRIVLLKAHDRKGFVFYTNLLSEKGQHLEHTPEAALNFWWKTLGRQVRIDGAVEPVTDAEADAYFASRPRESQLGAWASHQSAPLLSRDVLEDRWIAAREQFEGGPVPRPDFWSGFRVIPRRIEFWRLGDHRLHDRWRFLAVGPGWERHRLYP